MQQLNELLPGITGNIQAQPDKPLPKAEPVAEPQSSGPLRYIITSDKFSGPAELLYMNGLLQQLNMQETSMSAIQREKFKMIVPVAESGLTDFQKATNATIVQADYLMTFEMFWDKWGKTFPGMKVNKARCIPLWEAISKSEQVKCWFGIKPLAKWMHKTNRNFKYNPETYLRDKMWQNEY